jgi:hypothetical protein
MAYISTDEVKTIREEIKKRFPAKNGWKFRIYRENCSVLHITILQAPINFLADNKIKSGQIIRPEKHDHQYLQQIYSIANMGNYDNSDAMTDYFDCGFYVRFSIGEWGRDFIFVK